MFELIAGLLIALTVLIAVLEPLVRGRPAVVQPAAEFDWSDLDESDTPKVQALTALREIEFDHATGKLSDSDYEELRNKYSAKAVAAIDREKQDAAPVASGPDPAEALIRRARTGSASKCPVCSAQLEMGAVFCSDCGCAVNAEQPRPRCWTCGALIAPEAKFCGDCGAAQVEEPAGVN